MYGIAKCAGVQMVCECKICVNKIYISMRHERKIRESTKKHLKQKGKQIRNTKYYVKERVEEQVQNSIKNPNDLRHEA